MKVLQLVVKLAESEQTVRAQEAQLAALREDNVSLAAQKAALQEELERLQLLAQSLQKDVGTLPKVFQKAEHYRARYKSTKQESSAKLETMQSLLREATESVARLEMELAAEQRRSQESTTKWVGQLEVAERHIAAARADNVSLQLEVARSAAEAKRARRIETSFRDSFTITDEVTCCSVGCSTEVACATANVGTSTDSSEVRPRMTHSSATFSRPVSTLDAPFRSAGLEPSALQFGLLRCSDEQMQRMVEDGEILHRRQIERQIKIHDRLLATVANLQREACLTACSAVPPLPF